MGAGASPIPRIAQQYRLNVGTIVEAPMLQRPAGAAGKRGALKPATCSRRAACSARSRNISSSSSRPATRFVFAGEVLRFEGMRENDAIVTRAPRDRAEDPVL